MADSHGDKQVRGSGRGGHALLGRLDQDIAARQWGPDLGEGAVNHTASQKALLGTIETYQRWLMARIDEHAGLHEAADQRRWLEETFYPAYQKHFKAIMAACRVCVNAHDTGVDGMLDILRYSGLSMDDPFTYTACLKLKGLDRPVRPGDLPISPSLDEVYDGIFQNDPVLTGDEFEEDSDEDSYAGDALDVREEGQKRGWSVQLNDVASSWSLTTRILLAGVLTGLVVGAIVATGGFAVLGLTMGHVGLAALGQASAAIFAGKAVLATVGIACASLVSGLAAGVLAFRNTTKWAGKHDIQSRVYGTLGSAALFAGAAVVVSLLAASPVGVLAVAVAAATLVGGTMGYKASRAVTRQSKDYFSPLGEALRHGVDEDAALPSAPRRVACCLIYYPALEPHKASSARSPGASPAPRRQHGRQ